MAYYSIITICRGGQPYRAIALFLHSLDSMVCCTRPGSILRSLAGDEMSSCTPYRTCSHKTFPLSGGICFYTCKETKTREAFISRRLALFMFPSMMSSTHRHDSLSVIGHDKPHPRRVCVWMRLVLALPPAVPEKFNFPPLTQSKSWLEKLAADKKQTWR